MLAVHEECDCLFFFSKNIVNHRYSPGFLYQNENINPIQLAHCPASCFNSHHYLLLETQLGRLFCCFKLGFAGQCHTFCADSTLLPVCSSWLKSFLVLFKDQCSLAPYATTSNPSKSCSSWRNIGNMWHGQHMPFQFFPWQDPCSLTSQPIAAPRHRDSEPKNGTGWVL